MSQISDNQTTQSHIASERLDALLQSLKSQLVTDWRSGFGVRLLEERNPPVCVRGIGHLRGSCTKISHQADIRFAARYAGSVEIGLT